MKRALITIALACGLVPAWAVVESADVDLRIPDKIGLAGMAAVSLPPTADRPMPVIVMTGGANFPFALPGAKTPAERGEKMYHADVSVMLVPGSCDVCDVRPMKSGRMPYPIGYAAFAPSEKGMVVAGGCNANGHVATVTRVNVVGSQVRVENLPDLPVTLAYPAFAEEKGKLYVFGGQERADSTTCLKRSFVLDLSDTNAGWKELAPMPDDGRMLAGAGAVDGRIYVAGGCSLHPDSKGQAERTYLKSVLCYDPIADTWTTNLPDMPETIVGAANPLPSIGGSLYVVCGDPGNFYRASLVGKAPAKHPGQNKTIYSFTPASGKWSKEGENAVGVATCPAVATDSSILIISGETHPGIRTPIISILNLSK